MTRLSWWKIPLLVSVFAVGWVISSVAPHQTVSAQSTQPTQQAGNPDVTPKNNQSAEQQKKDISECYSIAQSRTGVDPSALGKSGLIKSPGTPTATESPTQEADSSASAAEAAASAAQKSAETAPSQSSGQGAAAAAKDKQLDAFRMANGACLQARGYLVKQPATGATPAAPEK
jgi:hypothetical protein